MREGGNPRELDRQGTIQTSSTTKVHGRDVHSWSDTYLNVMSKELSPLRSSGVESVENSQVVAVQVRSFKIRKENRTIVANKMRYQLEGVNYYIIQVRNYKGSSNWLVLDTVTRDNE